MAKPVGDFLDIQLNEKEASEEIKLSDTKEVVNAKIDFALGEAKHLHDEKLNTWEENDKYFNGDHWKVEGVTQAPYKSDVVINLMFPSVVNNVGLMTDSRPKVQIHPAPNDDKDQFEINQEKAKSLQAMVDYKWDCLEMPYKIGQVIYNMRIYNDAFLYYHWNEEEDDIDTCLIKPHNLYVSPLATSIDDADYVILRQVRSKHWIRKNFPDKADEIKPEHIKPLKASYISSYEQSATVEQYVIDEYWTNDILIIRSGKIILKGPIQNPFYNFSNKKKNYFKRPKKPFVKFPTFNVGAEFYSRDHFKQLKKIQQTINKRKAQLDDSLNLAGNPKIVYNNITMDEKEADKITNAPQVKIGVPGPPRDHIMFEGGQSPPSWIVQDLDHSRKMFDDVFMQHDITRGAKEISRKTATETSILREADQTLIRLLVRNLEVGLQELVSGWVQLMKLFYSEKKYARIIGKKETLEYISLSRDDIDAGVEVILQTGSTLPIDKNAKRSEAIQLVLQGKLSLLSLFEILEYPDPRKHVKRLFEEGQGQLELDSDTSMIETEDFQILPLEIKKAILQYLQSPEAQMQNPIARKQMKEQEENPKQGMMGGGGSASNVR